VPLLWISFAFIIGLALGASLGWPAPVWLRLGLAALLAWPVMRRLPPAPTPKPTIPSRLRWLVVREPRLFVPPLLLIAAVCLGAARYQDYGPDISGGHVAAYNDQEAVRLVAVVAWPPDRRDKTTLLRVEAKEIAPLDGDGKPTRLVPTKGLVQIMLAGEANFEYGDRLVLEGRLTTPPEEEEFSYREYLARKGVFAYMAYPLVRRSGTGAGSPLLSAIYQLRGQAFDKLYQLFPWPEAPLLAGILLGIESDLPDPMKRAFQDTGTAHVIAISGSNIVILAELFSRLFGRFFSRWRAMGLAILAVSGYTLLVGAAPSVVRAAIMGCLSLVGVQIGRRSAGINMLAVTAAVMCLFNPLLPWDASFQLSFGATLGLILYAEPLQQWFIRLLERRFSSDAAKKAAGPFGEYVLYTLAAQALTLPVILYHFQRLSLSSLLANPLILPAQPPLMVLSGLAVIAGLVSQPLGQVLSWFAWPLSAYTIRVVELLARIPDGVLVLGEINFTTVVLMYGVILAPAFNARFPEMIKGMLRPALLVIAAGLLAATLWRAASAAPDGRLHLTVFDMQGKQVLLVRGPGGQTVLVNGSDSPRGLNDTLGRWLSPFDREIDALLLNSPQAERMSGLATLLDRYAFQQVYWGCEPPKHRSGKRLLAAFRANHIPSHVLTTGQALNLGSGARIQVHASGQSGSALLITWHNFRALVPGGIPAAAIYERELTNPSLIILEKRDLENTAAEEWQAYFPQAVIFTPGAGDLPDAGGNWLITNPGGWYSIDTDGEKMWIERQ
jgi:competence protein ComEC